jgi:hypothetical protein
MARWTVWVVSIVVLSSGTLVMASEPVGPAVAIRIHDYASIDTDRLALAQQLVSRTFARIGVDARWLEPIRPLESSGAAEPTSLSELTIIVLTQEMAVRGQIPEGVVGYTPASGGQVGRIAFVIDERTRDLAEESATDHSRVLGLVMAHEIGHLLMPRGFHASAGLMRAEWGAADFRDLYVGRLEFLPSDAQSIHATLKRFRMRRCRPATSRDVARARTSARRTLPPGRPPPRSGRAWRSRSEVSLYRLFDPLRPGLPGVPPSSSFDRLWWFELPGSQPSGPFPTP